MVTYILVVLALFLVPGPAVFITVSQTIKGGKKDGILTGLGIGIGDLVHTLAAVLGLSAILMTSALAFEVVKYLGAAYLVYLGITAFIEKSKKIKNEKPVEKKVKTNSPFFQALLIELLNPKTALFFLAFLPQFVQSDAYTVTIQLLILGLVFVVMSISFTTTLVFLTKAIGHRLVKQTNQQSKWIGKVVGVIYIGLGLRLALESR